MKKLLLLLSSLVAGFSSQASHVIGGEIRYEYTSAGYRVEIATYKDCSTNPASVPASLYVTTTSSCTTPVSYSAALYASDTLYLQTCPSAGSACSVASAPRLYVVHRYSVLVPLPVTNPCSDWKFSYSESSRTGSIINLVSPSSQNFYVEAFLNNTVANNSSPVFGNDPAFFQSGGTQMTNPFQLLDIEGDSVSASFYQPMASSTMTIPYQGSTGATVASPYGSGSYTNLNVAGRYFTSLASFTGTYATAVRAYDYRNGVLVGYSSRDWCISVVPGTVITAPMPAPTTSFTTTTCPGATNTVTLNFVDSTATDSVYTRLVPQNGYAYTTAYSHGIGAGSLTTTWTTPGTLNPATTPYSFIKVHAYDNRCPIRGYANYTVLVRNASCNADSVWPGDANADKVVNMYDPLFVALAYGKTGASRTAPVTTWTPQVCMPWALSFNTGINMKHADADGNGTVDAADLPAITANYGLTHLRGTETPQQKQTGLPDLYFDHTGIAATPGSTINIPVKLGNTAQGMGYMLGIAARVRVLNTTPTVMSIAHPTSWIGNASNAFSFTKAINSNAIEWTYARKSQTDIMGQGQIATLTLTIPATASGSLVLKMEDVRIINAQGGIVTDYNVINDTLMIAPTGVPSLSTNGFSAMVIPNPSYGQAILALHLEKSTQLKLEIADVTGRVVHNEAIRRHAGSHELSLPTSLVGGMYLIRVSDGNEVQTIKWMKSE